MLVMQGLKLADADAMLSARRATARERVRHDAFVQGLNFLELFGVVRLDGKNDVKITVTDMSEQRRRNACCLELRLPLQARQ